MNFPQFWARGKTKGFIAWRWSSQSFAEAQTLANEAVQKLAARILSGDTPPSTHGGYYPNRPFREQILREIKNGAGETAAVITRNSYGCEVLNTARMMFVDIDLPEPKKKSIGIFIKFFSKPTPAPAGGAQGDALLKIENWTRNNPQWGWRIYRTRAGLRLLATQDFVDPDSAAAHQVFEALGSDPLYQTLCKSQKCFRARLTPKPWRCRVFDKPDRWPYLEAVHEQRFKKWESQYRAACDDYATCELLKVIGNSTVHPEIQPIVKLHDELTRAETKIELA